MRLIAVHMRMRRQGWDAKLSPLHSLVEAVLVHDTILAQLAHSLGQHNAVGGLARPRLAHQHDSVTHQLRFVQLQTKKRGQRRDISDTRTVQSIASKGVWVRPE